MASGPGTPFPQGGDRPKSNTPGPLSEADPRYRLDPCQLPKRIDLQLDDDLLARIEEMAARSGRSVEEIVVELLDRRSSMD